MPGGQTRDSQWPGGPGRAAGWSAASRLDTEPFGPDETAMLVRVAGRAPSIHNTQPWRFRVGADRVEVHADPDRELAAADPAGRQRTMSCGAAVLDLRLAMSNLGYLTHTVLLPDPSEPGHLATVVRGRRHPPSEEEHHLYQAVPRRHTQSHGFLPVAITPQSRTRLHAAARTEGAWVREPNLETRDEFAVIMVGAITTMVTDAAYRAELARWTRLSADPPDGVPLDSLGGGPYPAEGMPRPYLLPPAASPEWMATRGLLGTMVLGTGADEPVDWLRAGQALQRLLLTATGDGLVATFFSQVVEMPVARRRTARILDAPGHPQAVLRVGYAAASAATTPRRPYPDVADVGG
ncbi:MAG TPA: hypothetical protein VFX70_11695 [Mycobacteriales bacterium]|nr:hypothetical protein [Mycobacteriales bacterium]